MYLSNHKCHTCKKEICLFFIFILLPCIWSQQPCSNSACYPALVNLLSGIADGTYSNRTVAGRSTCGIPTATNYTKLTSTNDPTVYVCSSAGSSSHPANPYLYDTQQVNSGVELVISPVDSTYWQSQNSVSDPNGDPVLEWIEINLGDRFLITKIVMTFVSPHIPAGELSDARPKATVIEVKDHANSDSWRTWRYYAQDCSKYVWLHSQVPGGPVRTGPTNPICYQGYYAGDTITQLQDSNLQEVIYHPLRDWSSQFFTSASQSHYTAYSIRLRFLIPADSTPSSSYFAVSNIDIRGQCACFGHAAECTGPNQAECVCQHNTMGVNCDQCLPLYNNRSWQAAVGDQINACQECGCNAHAESCHYDSGVGYGICDNCGYNSTGHKCDQCISNHYKANVSDIPGVAWVCKECDCNRDGTLASSGYVCNSETGQCSCKAHVTGRTCDQCRDGYWNFQAANPDGCQACNCDPVGSLGSINFCNKDTGVCVCKQNTQGQRCSECKPGFFNLTVSNPSGCQSCDCLPGASTSSVCVANGNCWCRRSLIGRDCGTPITGYNVPKLDYFYYEAESALLPASAVVKEASGGNMPGSDFSGRGTVVLQVNSLVQFQIQVPRTQRYDILLRYKSDTSWPSAQVTLTPVGGSAYTCAGQSYSSGQVLQYGEAIMSTSGRVFFTCDGRPDGNRYPHPYNCQQFYQCSNGFAFLQNCPGDLVFTSEGGGLCVRGQCTDTALPPVLTQTVTYDTGCLQAGTTYTLALALGQDNSTLNGMTLELDLIMVLPLLDDLTTYQTSSNTLPYIVCMEAVKNLEFQQQLDSNCGLYEYSLMTELFNGAIGCSCNPTGTVPGTNCNTYGGKCVCKPGVGGRSCDQCLANHFGFSSGNGCTACGCDVSGSVTESCTETGVCTCKTNVTGTKCDMCIADHYGLYTGNGCQRCQCHLVYSFNNSCSDSGQCPCKPGVGGLTCDQCLDGFYALSEVGCIPCSCNVEGSAGGICNNGTGACQCKPLTSGTKCDTCQFGSYGLGTWDTDTGCIPCFCSGHTVSCSSATGWYKTTVSDTWSVNDNSITEDGWAGVSQTGNTVPTNRPYIFGVPLQRAVQIINTGNNLGLPDIYFSATPKYLGDKRGAYGQTFSVDLSSSTLDSPVNSTTGDVVLTGAYTDFVLVTNLPSMPGSVRTSYQVVLHQSHWRLNATNGPQASHQQMLQVLSDLSAIWVRAKYSNVDNSHAILYFGELEFAVNTVTQLNPLNNIENCTCPQGYMGQFCEQCAPGYKRQVPNGGPFIQCVPCQCNSHSEPNQPCNSETGTCTCIHSTTGPTCDTCLPGFYGDAVAGSPDDCRPCMCPGNVVSGDINVFALLCTLDQDGSPTCNDCVTGHGGRRCNECVQGYYGQPENITNNRGQCRPCQCNGRASLCDTVTGDCINCVNNTAGRECQICAPGYFGNAMEGTCQACSCSNSAGSTGECDPVTGRCVCLPNVEGDSCERCVTNAYNYSSSQGCTQCNCHPQGALSPQCNLVTGQCACRNNVEGQRCDRCTETFYNINVVTGCDVCKCNNQGTATVPGQTFGTCDQVTGQCTCSSPSITGRQCDQCAAGTSVEYNYVSGVTVGTFPACPLCGNCFDTWAKKIDAIGAAFSEQYAIVLNIWRHYDNLTSAHYASVLQSLEQNITGTQGSITRVQEMSARLQYLTQGFQQITTEVEQLTSILQTIEADKALIQQSVEMTRQFTGIVEVEPGVFRNASDLQLALNLARTSHSQSLVAGNTSFTLIQNLTQTIMVTNATMKLLVDRVSREMTTLNAAMQDRLASDSILSGTIKSDYQSLSQIFSTLNNDLAQVQQRVASLQSVIATASATVTSANQTATQAISIATRNQGQVQVKVTESQVTKFNATQSQRAALTAQSAALSYRDLAVSSRENITKALQKSKSAISDLQNVKDKTAQANSLASDALNINLRTLNEIKAITGEINNTQVSQASVSSTFNSATEALRLAQEALNITQTAVEESHMALEQVRTIQGNLEQAALLQNHTQVLMNRSDDHINTVNRVSAQVSAKASSASSQAIGTSQALSRVFNVITSTEQCFVSATRAAQAANTQAGGAFIMAQSAHQVNQANQARLQNLTTSGQSRSTATTAAQSELGTVREDMSQLQTDFSSIESSLQNDPLIRSVAALLDEYGLQRQEMQQLEAEINTMETELDTLLQDLEGVDPAAENCNVN
ncbi:laminin-like protein lam-2 [Lingula anatina]|uniref:Laminin-like protein lam-2 n=1 Tax=Lingula anatina TaxID=7574 RepID=A0A2R2MKD7_LINAN|nr:laminin-like protein lam-2 [Lingula anatina]|eukprot:XP_023930665.1 laminin-like protein lam-2 [Lingula anatina]